MTDYTDLQRDIVAALDSIGKLGEVQQRFNDAITSEVEKIWKDNEALRDEMYAVANRVERLTAYVVSDPAEVAAKIVTDANRQTLRDVSE